MDNKKRVLIVHNRYQLPGGEDTVVDNEKKLLEDNGHDVILYTRNNNEINSMSRLSKLMIPVAFIYSFKTHREINKIIKEKQVEIVHVHNTLCLISPAVYYAAISNNVPVIQTIHNFRLLCPGATFYHDGKVCEDCVGKGLLCAVKHNCYRNSKIQTLACVLGIKIHRLTGINSKINYICLTEFNKRKLMEQKQIKESRIFVKPNFVKTNSNIISFAERKNQFVFVGRLDKLKGIDLLLEAWKKLGEEALDLIVCGTGPLKEWCLKYVADNHLAKVKMIGFVKSEDVKKIMGESKALILPSQWYEGFPMSIVEAYSVGTPVLGSDIGNVGNIIETNVTGWKFKYNSVDDLIKATKCTKDIVDSVIAEYNNKYTDIKNYEQLKEIYSGVN